MDIVFATHNQGKLKEAKALLRQHKVIGAEEAGVFEDVVEDGKTMLENAFKKARFVHEKTGAWSVADDSGICIEALDGEPGIYSARWAGESATGEEIIAYTLEKMKDIPAGKRQAYFEATIAVISPEGEEQSFVGRIDGQVAESPKGVMRKSLPYDMIFIPTGDTRTFAQMSDDEKNSLSHRARALQQLKVFFENTMLVN
jgi:XTP/dITP diphosphohydrolase